MKICSYQNCNSLGILKGMCRKHYNAEYFKKNKKSILISHKEYYKQNQEKMQKWRKQYYKKYPEVSRRNKMIRKNRKNANCKTYTDLEVLNRYGSDCYLCSKAIDLNAPRRTGMPGWQNGLHIDHLVPVSMGGLDSIENVRPAHGLCNLKKYNLESAII